MRVFSKNWDEWLCGLWHCNQDPLGTQLFIDSTPPRHLSENMHQKLVPDLFLILVNNPKQPLHVRNYLKDKIF